MYTFKTKFDTKSNDKFATLAKLIATMYMYIYLIPAHCIPKAHWCTANAWRCKSMSWLFKLTFNLQGMMCHGLLFVAKDNNIG